MLWIYMCSIIISVVAAMCKQQSLLKVKDTCYVIFRHSEVFHTLPVFFYILDIIYVYIKYIGMRIYYIYIYFIYILSLWSYISTCDPRLNGWNINIDKSWLKIEKLTIKELKDDKTKSTDIAIIPLNSFK